MLSTPEKELDQNRNFSLKSFKISISTEKVTENTINSIHIPSCLSHVKKTNKQTTPSDHSAPHQQGEVLCSKITNSVGKICNCQVMGGKKRNRVLCCHFICQNKTFQAAVLECCISSQTAFLTLDLLDTWLTATVNCVGCLRSLSCSSNIFGDRMILLLLPSTSVNVPVFSYTFYASLTSNSSRISTQWSHSLISN